ncbi:hypothetical protein EJ06DRAFT_505356 [Trichodelitschia bisporula]|uniref:Rhodanese domain-containing protein n=1 Tax=Trichodelitschia bisporula TaxID=703511 RepID=A0A6G1I6W5_9PEZI|nr:hypothetical protein EJ06DRAFT_505356 [Trichodelitschia bisporula]
MVQEEQPWWASLPPPVQTAPLYKKENLLRQYAIIGDILNAGTLLIDVRRTDYEGGAIRGSLNMPAQSFYLNMPTLYRLCQGDGSSVITRVMFYCGSSSGRGPRCAGWFADYVKARAAQEETPELTQVFTLEGGIKGWVNGGPEYIHFMDGFVEDYWKQFAEPPPVAKRAIDANTEAATPAPEAAGDQSTKRQKSEA